MGSFSQLAQYIIEYDFFFFTDVHVLLRYLSVSVVIRALVCPLVVGGK
jgi:hypothetical protein